MRKHAQKDNLPKFTEQVKVEQNWKLQPPPPKDVIFLLYILGVASSQKERCSQNSEVSISSSEKWDLEEFQ